MHLLSPQTKAPHLVEDLVGGLRPREWPALVVVRGDVGEDRFSQGGHAGMRSAPQGFLGEHPEEPFDEVEPRRVGRREMQMEARVTQQPAMHGGRAMRGEIVQHDMDLQRRLDARVDLAQKRDEIGGAVTRLTSREHLAGGDVQGGEQVQRAVAHVIVRSPLGLPDVHRQDRLRALERLNLRLLVEREHGGVRRRIHVKPDDVAHFLDQLGIRRDLERFGHMRLQTKRAPDPTDRRVTQARGSGHRARTPVGFGRRRGFERLDNHALDVVVRNRAGRASPRLIVDALQAPVDEPLAPLPDGRIGGAVPPRHRAVQRAVRARQHETRAERQRSIHAGSLRQSDQRLSLIIGHDQGFLGASSNWHAPLDHNADSISS